MNTFFVNITESLDLKKDDESSLNPIKSENKYDILGKHKHHHSVHKISQTFMTFISPYSVRMRENTDQKKIRIWTLFRQCLKSTLDIHLPFITSSIDLSIEKGCFRLKNLGLLKLVQSSKKR